MAEKVDSSKIVLDSTLNMAAAQTPTNNHVLFVFKIGADGIPTKGSQGWYKIGTLIQVLGQEASNAKNEAIAQRKLAERYAKGTEGGVAVTSGEGYQDNAKYYRDQTVQERQETLEAVGALFVEKAAELDNLVNDESSGYKKQLQEYVDSAAAKAAAAAASAQSAEEAKDEAQSIVLGEFIHIVETDYPPVIADDSDSEEEPT